MAKNICAAVCAFALSLCVFCGREPVLNINGDNELYLFSDSSSCEILKVEGDIGKRYKMLTDVYGEAVGGLRKSDVDSIVCDFCAKKVFTENVDGITSEYLYSSAIPFYKLINGKKINLHIVCDGEKYKVGSPVIFGGY